MSKPAASIPELGTSTLGTILIDMESKLDDNAQVPSSMEAFCAGPAGVLPAYQAYLRERIALTEAYVDPSEVEALLSKEVASDAPASNEETDALSSAEESVRLSAANSADAVKASQVRAIECVQAIVKLRVRAAKQELQLLAEFVVAEERLANATD